MCITLACDCNLQFCFLSGSITSHSLMMNVRFVIACVAIKWNNLLAHAGALHPAFWHIITGIDLYWLLCGSSHLLSESFCVPLNYQRFYIPHAGLHAKENKTASQVSRTLGGHFHRPMTNMINWCCLAQVCFSLLPQLFHVALVSSKYSVWYASMFIKNDLVIF